MSETVETTEVSHEALIKAQKRRNVWLAWALVAFVVIVGLTTAIRIQETDFSGGDRIYFSGYMDEAASEKADREAQARIQARLDAERAAVTSEAQSEDPRDE
ncbi:MAG: hypothetical protein AAFP81_04860 [Pseudomonadota bacterium]